MLGRRPRSHDPAAAAPSSRLRRFLQLGDPRGRDVVLWVIVSIPAVLRLRDGGQAGGWRLWVGVGLLATSLGFLGLAISRLWRHRGTPSPDECPACGHEWVQHAVDDVDRVCEGCALEIDFGIEPRVAHGCRLAPAR